MYKYLETERLLIEPITINDSAFILELLNSEAWLQYIGERNVKDEDAAQRYIQKILDDTNCYYSVFKRKDTKQAVGVVTFIYRETQAFPDIGFALLPNYAKNGYAYEAVRKYLDEMISEQQRDKIIAITSAKNKNSIQLLERLGLTFDYSVIENNEERFFYTMAICR